MEREQMLRLFEAHREAEAARDIDGILNTFVPDPFLETNALGLRSEGQAEHLAHDCQGVTGGAYLQQEIIASGANRPVRE